MIPSFFVPLAGLPMTTSGKLDRRALPAPDWTAVGRDTVYAPSRTADEQHLVDIWREVLRLDKVGIHDNFFALGGHSLLATQVISRINRKFNVNLPPVDLFEAPTIEGLAERLLAALHSRAHTGLPPIEPVGHQGLAPMAFNQEPFWVASQLSDGPAPYDFHSATRLKGTLNVSALEGAINDVLRRHESLAHDFR